jgi:hypothetical protein
MYSGEKIEEYGFYIRQMKKYDAYIVNILEELKLAEKL